MSSNSKFGWFLLAPIVLTLLVVTSPASAKDLIVDVHFDDGSALPNAKFISGNSWAGEIKVKHENEFFTLNFKDLKTLEFRVEPGTSQVKLCKTKGSSCDNYGK